jgi:hypothetical protein
MTTITILNPMAKAEEAVDGAGPALESLRGARIGVRTDWIWPIFEHVVDEWRQQLEAAGATVIVHQAQNHTGPDSEVSEAAFAEFVESVDLVVVGLGN